MIAERLRMRHQPDRAKARNLYVSNSIHGTRGDRANDRLTRIALCAMFGIAALIVCYLWSKP